MDSLFKRLTSLPSYSTEDAYAMGLDCGKNGASEKNCHFRLFARPELTKAWERGNADGKRMRKGGRNG